MARSILNSFSTIQIVILGVGATVLLAVCVVLVARRLFPSIADSEFDTVADHLRVVYELIFALILAFVIASVLDEMGNAESTVASEATTISQLVRTNDAFPNDDTQRLNAALRTYVRAVGQDEWATMKHGNSSPQAAAALDTVYAEYRDLSPRNDNETENYSQALSKLDDVASIRRERLNIAASDQPTMLRVLVLVGLIMLLVIEYRPKLSRFAGLAFMVTLAVVVSSAFLLTVILDYPFAGKVSVSNQPLKQDTLAQFWSEELAYAPGRGDTKKPLTPAHLVGVWDSLAFGALVMRCYRADTGKAVRKCRPGDKRMRGVYRFNHGTVTGRITRGVFRGWWAEKPKRSAPGSAGAFEWRLVETADGHHIIVGAYRHGLGGTLKRGWDLHEIGGREPRDLDARFDEQSTFRETPRPRS
ncbi:MAG: hypothetical protein ACRDKY_04895 [Solirubrobacteraceae bacterium]